MLKQIKGLHHVTSIASSAQENNAFFTKSLGLRRVKKTVNFDNPKLYHLYFGDEAGSPGTVITYFPNPNAKQRREGTGEVSWTRFSVPIGALDWWERHFTEIGITHLPRETTFGQSQLPFLGPDGENLALVETNDAREPWRSSVVPRGHAIRGFHSVELRLKDTSPTRELLQFMGYETAGQESRRTRLVCPAAPTANVIDLLQDPDAPAAKQGAGSVHHLAFSVATREGQTEVQKALTEAGWAVTPVKDRDYFWAIYFRSPEGILFEVATNEPGFTRDEELAHLGEALRLPQQHAHLRRELIETYLEPITET